jgi:adenylate cyclase
MNQTHRLAAILAADVAGYSRLMGADEKARSNASRRCAMSSSSRRSPSITAASPGRSPRTKTTGDGMLVEFAPQS